MLKILQAMLLLICSCICHAQSSIDSLHKALNKNIASKDKAVIYEQIAGHWIAVQQPDSVRYCINQFLKLSEKEEADFFTDKLSIANQMLFTIGANEDAIRINERYLKQFIREQNNAGLTAVWYNMGRAEMFQGNMNKADALLNKVLTNNACTPKLRATASLDLGNVYASEGKNTEALALLTATLDQTDSAKDINNYSGLLFSIGNAYGMMGDNETSIKYHIRTANMMKGVNPMAYANALINIASGYNDLKEYNKAEAYARKALQLVEDANANPNALSDVLYTLSEVLLQQHKYTAADVVYKRMQVIAAQTGNPLTQALSDLGLAHISHASKNYNQSLGLLQKATPFLEQNGSLYEITNCYQLQYENYEQLGDYKNAFLSFEKYHTMTDSISNENKIKEMTLMQSRFEFQKKEVVYQKERRIRNIVIISLSIIFCLATLLAIFIFKNRQKLNTQKQMALDAQLKKTEHDLALSKIQLEEFALGIQEKSRLVEVLEQQVMNLPDPDNALLEQLQQSTILTEDDWERFRQLFEQVHAGFLNRMKAKFTEISKAEIRFITLAKLRFSTREMAATLGVSPQSIRTNWYRIRKKLELPEEMSVEEFVSSI